ncbi:MAG: helix-turn-helix domain-containing protein [Patescibacteria group bacterium]|nr:helix-turn-helix domain-containing protein [Patescibacteria group bacterium]
MPPNLEPHHDLKSLMNEALELRNVNHEKLAQLTGISERYIWAIQNIEVDKLPPLPYVRGYLKKIAEALHLNHDEIWDLYKKELAHKTSGKFDRLPENRFAIRQLSHTKIVWTGLGILLALYLALNAGRLIGKPDLVVTYPQSPMLTSVTSPVTLTGSLDQSDKLTINGTEVFVNADNTFQENYPLQPGLNTITFTAARFLGRQTSVTRQILYVPQAVPAKP